ncbi:MAG: hypothetical protein M3Q33_12375 [Acidobacteriota bacterium]|nr:hypothetical protein [Acidobacteriota bacterium]
MIDLIKNRIYDFFIDSNDFNGIPLRQISNEFGIEYEDSIDLIKTLVENETVSIQSSTNPHIIGSQHYSIENQIAVLEDAKKNEEIVIEKIGDITIVSENTEFPICLYPSKKYLEENRDLSEFENEVYTKQLALGEPHLKPIFFDIEVLERYANDPRFDFKFRDYSGSISCKYDENENPIVRDEDQVFLQTFGLGFDSDNNRLAVVYLRYLKDLTSEHQIFWKSKEIKGSCKMLEEYHENTILGNWSSSYSVFTGFIGELSCLNELSEMIFGKPIFRKSFENENRPKEFTFFFSPTLKNYNDFVLLLDKMISDNINKDFFTGEIELFDIKELEEGLVERIPKGTLRLFEEWLLSQYNTDNQEMIKNIFKSLKDVREQRQNPAHRIDENIYDKKYIEKQREMISSVYSSIRAFREIFQQHPKTRNFVIPEWLDKGEIKIF